MAHLNLWQRQMDAKEIGAFLLVIAEKVNPVKANKGLFMKECAQLRGKADMRLVAQMVDAVLQ